MRTRSVRFLMVGVAAVLGATVSPTHAQFFQKAGQALVRIPDPTSLPRDILHERHYEHRLQHDQARLQADLGRGDTASVNRDLRRIGTDERLIELYRWDIRRDSFQNPGPSPHFSRQTGSATGLVPVMTPTPTAPAVALAPAPAAKVPITIGNAGPAGPGPAFTIDGTTYQATTGQMHQLEVAPTSVVTYDRGGAAGAQRYALTTGAYEFRPSNNGWALYKLPEASASAPR